jgi:transmembrane sensor
MSDELLGKYIAGEATADEQAAVRRWLAENPDNPAELARLERIWNVAGARQAGTRQLDSLQSANETTFDTDAAWQRVRRQMHRPPQSSARPTEPAEPVARPHPALQRTDWLRWARVAAAVLLIGTFAILTYRSFQTPDAIAPTTTLLTQSTTGSTRQLILPDGSKVLLNQHSSLRYPSAFGAETREVTLTGEAFFDVTPNSKQPFIIHAQETDVRVVGTSFGVRAYNRNVEVSVKTGQVIVRKKQQQVALKPGQQALVDSTADTLRRLVKFDANVLAYGTKQLEFTDQPLSSVVKTLSAYYQTDISLAASRLQSCRLTAQYRNESIDTVLGLVAETLQLTVQRTEKGFVLTGEGCQAPVEQTPDAK